MDAIDIAEGTKVGGLVRGEDSPCCAAAAPAAATTPAWSADGNIPSILELKLVGKVEWWDGSPGICEDCGNGGGGLLADSEDGGDELRRLKSSGALSLYLSRDGEVGVPFWFGFEVASIDIDNDDAVVLISLSADVSVLAGDSVDLALGGLGDAMEDELFEDEEGPDLSLDRHIANFKFTKD